LRSAGKGFLIDVFQVYGHLIESTFLLLHYEIDLLLSLSQSCTIIVADYKRKYQPFDLFLFFPLIVNLVATRY
jgi:hypothetical protein